jgi:hypothetical protein
MIKKLRTVREERKRREEKNISSHRERSVALIFPGEKLNVFCAARRVNYMEVIYNLTMRLSHNMRCFVPRQLLLRCPTNLRPCRDRKDETLLFVYFFASFAFFAD